MEPAESSTLGAFAVLDLDSFSHLLRFLHSVDVARLGGCSTALRACCLDDSALWRAMLEREHGPVLANIGPAPAACARSLFPRARALSSLSTVAWTQHIVSVTPREGSACAVVGDDLILVGGWTPTGLSNEVARMRTFPDADFPPGPMQFRGHLVYPSVRIPPRYGHSCTAVANGVLIFGGMTGGGYMGELNDIWLLQTPQDAGVPQLRPTCSGEVPQRRGYHSACASADGKLLYIFGGIGNNESLASFHVLDTESWTWTAMASPSASQPCARFGHSMLLFGEQLWLFGGGNGGDLLRDGVDLTDVWTYCLRSGEWTQVELVSPAPYSANLGRCHSAVKVGHKALLFGGSTRTSNHVSWFDTQLRAFGAPLVAPRTLQERLPELPAAPRSPLPPPRFTHLAALLGSTVVVACGYKHGPQGRGCLGDVWSMQLCPDAEQRQRAQQQGPELRFPVELLGEGWEEQEEEEEEEEMDEDDYVDEFDPTDSGEEDGGEGEEYY